MTPISRRVRGTAPLAVTGLTIPAEPPTSLIAALTAGDWETALSLIHAGDAVCLRDPHGHTPLMLAAGSAAALPVLQALLAAGVPVDAQNDLGWTALMVAVVADNMAAIYALMGAGADPTVADGRGETALTKAQAAGRGWIVRRLTRGGTVRVGAPVPTAPLAVDVRVAGEPPVRKPVAFEDEPPPPWRKPTPPKDYGMLGNWLMAKQPAKPAVAPDPVTPPNRPLRSTRPLMPAATRPMR